MPISLRARAFAVLALGAASITVSPGRASALTVPTLTTSAGPNGDLGQALFDSATLSGGSAPTGHMSFAAYGPGDADCSPPAAFTTAVTVFDNSTVLSNGVDDFVPTQAGTYRWVATYSGDANNSTVSSTCNDPGESNSVGRFDPTISTQVGADAPLGGSIHDTAVITGGSDSLTGDVTFTAYGPDDADCSGPAAFTTTVSSNGNNGTVDSNGLNKFTPPSAGTYRWVASYSGDASDSAASGKCNDPHETSVVSAVTRAPVRFFVALRIRGGILLRWTMASQSGVAGFNLSGGTGRLTTHLIPRHRQPTYVFTTQTVADTYSVVVVMTDGRSLQLRTRLYRRP
jgi:hypothetical protein